MTLLFWLPFCFAALHIFEEFAWPGGFAAWYTAYRPYVAGSLTTRFLILGNALLLVVTFLLGWMGPSWSRGLSLWLILAALLAANGLFHLRGVIALRRYSPGVVSGVLLYLPLCVWGYWHFIASGEASWQFAAISFMIGASYQLWTDFNHRRRSATVA
ncbi:MAG TPA: HXXEE domain-containing protein [Chthoniobacterales bacterium]|jgi:hypothetical protein